MKVSRKVFLGFAWAALISCSLCLDLQETFDTCTTCKSSTCNLAGYTDEECMVKWDTNTHSSAVRFIFKVQTPETPSWFAIGFNPIEKKMVNYLK